MTTPDAARRYMLRAAFATPLAAALSEVLAQSSRGWPDRPIRFVLGYPTGGAADGVGRALTPRLEADVGQPWIIDYRPGAGATIAAEATARAAPDGYTLHLMDAGPMTIVPNGKKVSYDPVGSFAPIGMVCSGGTLVVAHPSVPANNVEELVKLARSSAQPLNYGTSGVGGAGHLAGELFQTMTQTKLVHVPYKGGSQAAVDLIGGQIPLLFSSMATAIPHVQSGKIRAIGVTSERRSAALPNVPTLAEQGLPGYEATVWFGLVGPAGLPADIVTRANRALNAALSDAAVQDAIRRQGYDPEPGTPSEFAARIRSDLAKWGKVIRDAKIAFD